MHSPEKKNNRISHDTILKSLTLATVNSAHNTIQSLGHRWAPIPAQFNSSSLMTRSPEAPPPVPPPPPPEPVASSSSRRIICISLTRVRTTLVIMTAREIRKNQRGQRRRWIAQLGIRGGGEGMGLLTCGGAQCPDPQDLEAGALLAPPGHHWSRDDLERGGGLEGAARISGRFSACLEDDEISKGFGFFQSIITFRLFYEDCFVIFSFHGRSEKKKTLQQDRLPLCQASCPC